MRKNDYLNDMLQYAQFHQIKEMLLCMNGFSYSDKRMVKIINSNGGLDKYFQELKSRYINFLEEKKKMK